jgi:hypothetical protein
MRFPLLRLLLSAPKTLGAERLLITLVKSSAAPLLRRFLGVALANFEITGQHLPESLEQRSSGQFPENNQYLGCSTLQWSRLEQSRTGN